MEKNSVTPVTNIRGLDVPSFFYGTAWKEDRSAGLTYEALKAGFRAVDTANQRKHYHEAGVGEGIAKFLKESNVKRAELFLQTKFTYERGQDHRLPYDPKAGYADQVAQSFSSSLEHLKTDYIDSYVLHGPATGHGLVDEDFEVWGAMEKLALNKKTRLLGVLNINYEQLSVLLSHAKVKPAFVQNRCFASSKWDQKIRGLCSKHDVRYQGFSLLTANMASLHHPVMREIMQRTSKTIPQIIFRYAMQIGMVPLTGTTDVEHMREDLILFDFQLNSEEMDRIENIAF